MILWTPSDTQVAQAAITTFRARLAAHFDTPLPTYDTLYRFSIERSADFWSFWWDDVGVVAERKGARVLENPTAMPGARWFPDARLNFAENLLRWAQQPDADQRVALVARDETGRRRSFTYAALEEAVARLARALQRDGVGVGDRVAGFVPNGAEAVIAMLATTRLGAIWSSTSTDFGVDGVIDRFGQIEPRVLFAPEVVHYGGKRIDLRGRLADMAARLPSLRRVVVFDLAEARAPATAAPVVSWDEYLHDSSASPAPPYTRLPFDHPVYILYSSGTTGVPKAIVHGAGGTLLQQWKEHALHTDVRAGERVFYFTTCGWMMWNWLVAALGLGATLVLYDGSPFHPHEAALWDLAEQEGVAAFGTSAKYLAALEKAGVKPGASHNLPDLRALLSTGSPLSPEGFAFAYRDIKRDLLLASISGGTDIVSCFALGNPARPVRAGELQGAGLGMAVAVFDDNGVSLPLGKGELVCTAPFPSMPVGFWNDPHGDRYRAAYFERFPGVWAHGDYAERTPHDGLVIHGRSDAVLNPGGVRIGTAEIYRVVEQLPEVVESICIGQPHQGDVRVVLFVHTRPGVALDDALKTRIRQEIRRQATPRHVPEVILAVPEIPRTKSGKVVELAVRATVMGEPVRNLEALANPDALRHFRDRPELQG